MKKELGFPVSGSRGAIVGRVLSATPNGVANPRFFLISFVSHLFLYIHPSRPFSFGEVGLDEEKGESRKIRESVPLSILLCQSLVFVSHFIYTLRPSFEVQIQAMVLQITVALLLVSRYALSI